MDARIENESRRRFLQAGAGLTLAVYLPAFAAPAGPGQGGGAVPAPTTLEPNAFVRIGSDDTVTVVVKHLEMGQGVNTGLPTLVAEELDAAWSQLRIEHAPADAKRYNNLLWGPTQGTGGSTAMANSFEQFRRAGATARAMLVAAAAQAWQVDPAGITVREGVVTHAASKRQARFGELAERAARLAPPPADSVRLKEPKDFVYIGKRVPRTDSSAKVNGSAVFTQDLHLPDMLVAVVAHPPRYGATVKSFDAAPAKAVKGVVEVVQIPTGVAVLAHDTWTAIAARDALKVQWDESGAFKQGSAEIMAGYRELAARPGLPARRDGDADKALQGAGKTFEAAFEFPFLAHAAMEPMNCVAKLGAQSCELWNGAQLHSGDQAAVAAYLGLAPAQVTIHTLFAGGSFGRRANPKSDYPLEAVSIARALQGGRLAGRPVKLVWTREDDTRAGYFRPMYFHTLHAALGADGLPVAWRHRIVGQSILKGTAFEPMLVKDGIDLTSVEGAASLPYAIANLSVELHTTDLPVPVQWWRSVGSTHTAFSTETFLDELARAAGADAVAYRLALLKDHPRHAGVLKLAADRAGWGKPLAAPPAGAKRGRGVAVHESFNSYVAQVAEVTVAADGSFRVDRVVCAVDCGVAVNPDVIRAQMEGGIGYGLAAALHGAITLEEGAVAQSNFHDYPVLRINEMPAIEVHIVPSNAKPTGVGEPGTPVIAPAVANALFDATGRRLRNLPLKVA